MLHPSLRRLPYAIGLIIYTLVFFKNAWVSDDAFILFRSLDQLLDGHGPRWNPHERVQVFTCPLWYWLLAAMGSVYRNHYLNSILISAVCNGLLLWNLHRIFSNARIWLLAVLMLVLSQAYFDFTTSGLENPLAYCLLSFMARFALNREQLPDSKTLLATAITCGLLLVTRHDLLLFMLPILAYRFWQSRHANLAIPLLALLLPLTCWTFFSLLYYGFPFPNTAYAKLGNNLSQGVLLQRGVTYFTTSIMRDFISVVALPLGVLAGFLSHHRGLQMIALGIVLHLTYVLWIGGDFMRGRFFGWDYLLCVILLLYPLAGGVKPGWITRGSITTTFVAIAAAISAILWEPPVLTPLRWGAEPFRVGDSADGITQERHFFYWFTAFWKSAPTFKPLLLNHGWCQDGLEQRRQNIPLAASHTVGMHGFCLGTDKVLVDMLGITDPLLARMPHNPSQLKWRAGHLLRLLPAGYCSSIRHGDNRISDPAIAAFYDKIRLLTQSEMLVSRERLAAIWQINTGGYQQEIATIQSAMTQDFLQNNGAALQTEAQQDCPFIELPLALIEQLRNGSVERAFTQ